MKKILITGFGAFKEFDINPSAILVEHFQYANAEIHKAIFQVNKEYIDKEYPKLLNELQPDGILNIGLHASTGGFQLETFALNSLKDKGVFFQNQDNNIAFKTSLDTYLLAQKLSDSGVPTLRSDHAGNYYCNYIYYLSLQYIYNKNKENALFLHIPYDRMTAAKIALQQQKIYPSLELDLMLFGLERIVNEMIKTTV